MLVSILHRVTGDGMAVFGTALLVWWLYAAATGGASYATFQYYVWQAAPGDTLGCIANVAGRILLVGLTWAFFQHLLSGLRHFVLDMGAGYELKINRTWSLAVLALSVVLTALFWGWLLMGRTY